MEVKALWQFFNKLNDFAELSPLNFQEKKFELAHVFNAFFDRKDLRFGEDPWRNPDPKICCLYATNNQITLMNIHHIFTLDSRDIEGIEKTLSRFPEDKSDFKMPPTIGSFFQQMSLFSLNKEF